MCCSLASQEGGEDDDGVYDNAGDDEQCELQLTFILTVHSTCAALRARPYFWGPMPILILVNRTFLITDISAD